MIMKKKLPQRKIWLLIWTSEKKLVLKYIFDSNQRFYKFLINVNSLIT